MKLKVYLSGEIHTNWRNEIKDKCKSKNLEIEFSSPTTNHELSDDVGVKILGNEDVFGRGFKFKKIPLDSTYPKYIFQNKEIFSSWII